MFGLPASMTFDGLDIQVTEFIPINDGDFNDDGFWDCTDINLLSAATAASTNDPDFDLTGDGLVNMDDIDAWLVEGGAMNLAQTGGNPFLPGDANLDGVVDGLDFIQWNNAKFTDNTQWCGNVDGLGGNFNGDAVTDGLDFVIWNAFKFQSSDGAIQVVLLEPSTNPRRDRETKDIRLRETTTEATHSPALPVTPLAAQHIDSVFATVRHHDKQRDEPPSLDFFENLVDASPIKSYVLWSR